MNIPGRALLLLATTAGAAAPSLALEGEAACRMRASTHAGKAVVTAMTGVGVLDRTTTVRQTFATPYRRDTVSQLHHYRSDARLEVLPVGASYGAGGNDCNSTEIANALLFDLSHGDEESRAEIPVAPETPVVEGEAR